MGLARLKELAVESAESYPLLSVRVECALGIIQLLDQHVSERGELAQPILFGSYRIPKLADHEVSDVTFQDAHHEPTVSSAENLRVCLRLAVEMAGEPRPNGQHAGLPSSGLAVDHEWRGRGDRVDLIRGRNDVDA